MQRSPPPPSYSPTAKRPWLWLVLVGFLWLQFAGMVHKNLHTDLHVTNSQLEQILPEHSQQNPSDCQLLDLQCFGAALSQAMPTLALPVFERQTIGHTSVVLTTRIRTAYLARAPPALI